MVEISKIEGEPTYGNKSATIQYSIHVPIDLFSPFVRVVVYNLISVTCIRALTAVGVLKRALGRASKFAELS